MTDERIYKIFKSHKNVISARGLNAIDGKNESYTYINLSNLQAWGLNDDGEGFCVLVINLADGRKPVYRTSQSIEEVSEIISEALE